MEGLHLVMAITDREKSDKVIAIFDDNNVATTYALMGEGTAPPEVLDYLYLSPSEKIIVFGVVTNTGIAPLIKSAKRKLYIDYPGNGIMVSVPLNSVGGKRCLQYIMEGQAIDMNEKKPDEVEREERMAIKTDHEMIFVIANEGYSDMIMDAARGAGAKGGTVIKARGTGAENTEKFLGFSIAKEKEIHLLVTPAQGRNHIMKAIMEKAGLESKAQAMVFSLPVSHAIGLKMPE
ncbi:MAG: P-II family nitrogen regulator [Firmicutes bacterium]|nr:P-II family nitrogen regulator [Bacillota bacterium]